ncbi:MAG: hypothetical protein KDK34_22245, partial [Leptospiraceae bacterium]|nr:hypothetical protein [Leptospiraceae bacterium]
MSISADNTFDTAHSIRIIRNGTRRAFVLTLSLLAPAIILADSDRGRCQSGDCYNGRGVYVWSDGGRLESEFQRGAPIGNIQYREPGGAFLNTHLVNGKAQGPSEYRSRTGETYSGVLHKHIRHGNGTITFAGNRGSYQGDFQNNQAHGSGTYTTQDGGIITGRFQANRAHGNIRATMRGVTFDGLTSEGLANGAGEVRLSNGDSIHSQFESGQIAATGRIAFANGAEYQGDMLLGRPHGTGTLRTGQG